MTSSKNVAFLGASTGVGLAALKHTLAAGHQCVALCRVPSKLTAVLPAEPNTNLRVMQGNAHDVSAVSQLIRTGDGRLVDTIVSTIGAKPSLSSNIFDDAEVCQKGMATLLEALNQLRKGGATGSPHIIVCGTTGMSKFGRDIPLAMVPLYHVLLKIPHADKGIMEERLVGSGEEFTIVHAAWLTNGASDKEVRVGVEDPKTGRESLVLGYTISREDAGKWFADNLISEKNPKYIKKIASICY